jgi:ADP-heptose:LPS heptosyltransferase
MKNRTIYTLLRGSLGDIAIYLSRLENVRKTYPESKLVFGIQSDLPHLMRELVRLIPGVDAIEILPDRDLTRNLSEVTERKIRSNLSSEDVFLKFLIPGYGDAAKFKPNQRLPLHFSKKDLFFRRWFFEKFVGNHPLITIHTTSLTRKADSWFWPVDQFEKLCKLILNRYQVKILVAGGTSICFSHPNLLDLTNNRFKGIQLSEMLSVILESKLVLGGDSGFTVIPHLCKIPVISMVPNEHITKGFHSENLRNLLPDCPPQTVHEWISITPENSFSHIFPLETSAEEVFKKIGLLMDAQRIPKPNSTNQSPLQAKILFRSRIRIFFQTVMLDSLQGKSSLGSNARQFFRHFFR